MLLTMSESFIAPASRAAPPLLRFAPRHGSRYFIMPLSHAADRDAPPRFTGVLYTPRAASEAGEAM